MHVQVVETVRHRRPSRRILVIGLVAFVIVLAGSLLAYARYFGPADEYAAMSEFLVTPDQEFAVIAHDLKVAGYIRSITAFRVAFALTGNIRGVREGGYRISPSMDAWSIASALAHPPYLAWVTFKPGLRKEEIATILAKKLEWTPEEKETWLTVDTVPNASQAEGVYPGGTYLIPSDRTPAEVAVQLRARFQEEFAPYAELVIEKNITWTEAITMASLIEREAAKSDKALIAGILWNRINDGMRLQVDATLQYIRGEEGNWWPVPNVEDKKIDSPYNTYKYAGLPPHPIANPSIESIEAALNPEKTKCIYYLHDTDGVIHCSPTYAGQVANVNKYLK
ncbi:MAG: UPF0755 protein [Parcubacteria bacterium C7867-004]|nr:MAG: UPF0755 protein [Parcubacteria bacterium C7867-004]